MAVRRDGDDADILLEAATSAFRERDTYGRVRPSPAWTDLAPAQRDELFQRQMVARLTERAMDPQGISSTARTVLERTAVLKQLPEGQ